MTKSRTSVPLVYDEKPAADAVRDPERSASAAVILPEPAAAESTPAQVASAALVRAMAAMPTVHRDGTGQIGTRKYGYVTLDTVMGVIRPTLAEQGLALMQYPEGVCDGRVGVRQEVIHQNGHVMDLGTLWMPVGDDKAQSVGSALTYARRYAASAAFGLVCDEDDDGAAASTGAGRSRSRSPAAPSRSDAAKIDAYRAEFARCAEILQLDQDERMAVMEHVLGRARKPQDDDEFQRVIEYIRAQARIVEQADEEDRDAALTRARVDVEIPF